MTYRSRRAARCAALLAALLLACPLPAQATDPAQPPLKVLAAGSLRLAFTALFERWQRLHPEQPVQMDNGPAGWLRQRIEGGEAFDLYASAALTHAEALYATGRSGPAVLFAHNALCLLVKADGPIRSDNAVRQLLRPTTRIATSTPGADPGGDYAWEYFRRLDQHHPGAFAALSRRAQQRYGAPPQPGQPAPPSAASLIAGGEVDAAFGYCSGTRRQTHPAVRSVTLPAPAPLADYGLALAPQAKPAAAELALFILSPVGQQVLAEYGFIAVGLPTPAPSAKTNTTAAR